MHTMCTIEYIFPLKLSHFKVCKSYLHTYTRSQRILTTYCFLFRSYILRQETVTEILQEVPSSLAIKNSAETKKANSKFENKTLSLYVDTSECSCSVVKDCYYI